DAKLARVGEVLGARLDDTEINSLAMNTTITDDRDGALEFFAGMFGAPKEHVAQTPALIVGSVDEIVETLQERRDRWGFNYVVVQQNGGQGLERFNEVISTLAGS
ncbi:MAG: LLM class F420-dependent oxidoreductase, partial [Flavobacteriia bacterium]|nr:LLM class F420-dependent oxidoreductase [Flavobacteriia bacterium]